METRPRKSNGASSEGRFSYVREARKRHSKAIDAHHIFLRRYGARFPALSAYYGSITLSLFLFVLFNVDSIYTIPAKLFRFNFSVALWILASAAFIWIHRRKQVERESVIIFPSLGVQLEIVYRSGKRVVRRFVPMGKILKPVLNECVTPVTCYWSLSLILRGEEELLLVFKNLYPPVTMLRPIWEALLAAKEQENRPEEEED
ncbi:hypothetical protein M569_14101 [Genlisea aurea]|uniref:Phosphatidylinositol N-acetylglucosaminyltransferase subunit H conserved domain-containing protein n=1 Tax=Genlisea aurea TaxID=192259 RepID=S8C1X4_9LAMI|nr:hypothetical protein M569_14101 [Genlisea aurea]